MCLRRGQAGDPVMHVPRIQGPGAYHPLNSVTCPGFGGHVRVTRHHVTTHCGRCGIEVSGHSRHEDGVQPGTFNGYQLVEERARQLGGSPLTRPGDDHRADPGVGHPFRTSDGEMTPKPHRHRTSTPSPSMSPPYSLNHADMTASPRRRCWLPVVLSSRTQVSRPARASASATNGRTGSASTSARICAAACGEAILRGCGRGQGTSSSAVGWLARPSEKRRSTSGYSLPSACCAGGNFSEAVTNRSSTKGVATVVAEASSP